jgi:putative zinc finger/helix-turn-helix YgiT family protein
MKSPVTGKKMEIRSEKAEHEFRKEKFMIVYHYYFCKESGQSFQDERLMQLNLNQVYNQFRRKHNLPFPEEIVTLREQYGLSAAKMAEVLGFGINVYRQYENGEIPSLSNARLMQLAQDPREFSRIIELGNVLKEKERKRIVDRVNELHTNISGKPAIKKFIMGTPKADETTGYRIPSLEKLAEMVIFFSAKCQPWKTKLNKLLFYADFIHFKSTGISISGCRYRAIDMGPVPDNFNSLFDYLAREAQIEISYTVFPNGSIGEQFKRHTGRALNEKIFDHDEWSTLQQVDEKFGLKSTSEMIELSHQEEAWKKNYYNGKSLISYTEAFNLLNC